jgi:tetratricopeptide (TPR) repeat protein
MASKETLGGRLLRLRTEKGLTQKEVAEPEYTASYISTIEAGRRKPSMEAVEHFARRLGLEPKEILTGEPKDLDVQIGLDLHRAKLLINEGRFDEAVDIVAKARRESRRYQMADEEARCEVALGHACRRKGDVEAALAHNSTALEILRNGPPSARVDALVEIARCHQMLGDVRYAIHVLESYLDELKRAGITDPRALMLANATLVNSYFAAGLFPQAAVAGEQAQRLTPVVSDPEEVANLHISVARVLAHQGFRDEALRALRRAETIYESLDWGHELATARLAKGIVLADNDETVEAQRALGGALDILSRYPHPTNKARTLNELARLERLDGNAERGLELLKEAYEILDGVDGRGSGLCLLEMGLCKRETDPVGAEKDIEAALDIFRRAGDPTGEADSLKALGDLLIERGSFREAAEVYREGIEIAGDASRSEVTTWAR